MTLPLRRLSLIDIDDRELFEVALARWCSCCGCMGVVRSDEPFRSSQTEAAQARRLRLLQGSLFSLLLV